MSKNLSKHKIVVKTRECIVQAIYQIFMEDTIVSDLIDQFRAEVNEKKIDYQFMKKRLDNFEENKVDFTCLLYTSPSPRDNRTSRMPSSA